MKTLIVLSNGREIGSGGPGAAVAGARLTRRVNPAADLLSGGVSPARLELTLTDAADVTLSSGDTFTLCREDNAGKRQNRGVFHVQSATARGSALEIVALDNLCLLDKDLTLWLSALDGWPYPMQTLARMVCDQCGVGLAGTLPQGGIPVEKFYARDITGGDILGWLAQLSGRFCRIDDQGEVDFAWYTPRTEPVKTASGAVQTAYDGAGRLTLLGIPTPEIPALPDYSADDDGQGNLRLILPENLWYYQGSLYRAAAPAAPIRRVILRRTSSEVGVAWPDGGNDGDAYILSGGLLGAVDGAHLETIAQSLYAQLSAVTCTSCRLSLPDSAGVTPGQILSVTDRLGRQFHAWVMQTVTKDGRTEIQCNPDLRRGNGQSISSLRDKLLLLQSDAEGLRIQHQNTAGKLSRLELDVNGIQARVEHREEAETGLAQRLTQVEQKADGVEISVRKLTDDGVSRVVTRSGYSFTEDGLQIRRQGEQMQNRLDHTGMYVTRGEDTLLQVNHKGVEATDVTVRNYLIVGDHARFEDYETGTACYYI